MILKTNTSIMNLGDTSFRRKNLLEDYKILIKWFENQNLEWNQKNNSQLQFYSFVVEQKLVENNFYSDYEDYLNEKNETEIFQKYKDKIKKEQKSKDKKKNRKLLIKYFQDEQAKRARTYSNSLVKIGLINNCRKLTNVGKVFASESIVQSDFEKFFDISNDNIIFFRQLSKLKIYTNDKESFFSPFNIGLYLLTKFDDIPQQHFSSIVTSINPKIENQKYIKILNEYQKVKEKSISFDEYFMKNIIEMNNEKSSSFSEDKISFNSFKSFFKNRKSSNSINIYYSFYKIAFDFYISKEQEKMKDLKYYSNENKIRKAFGYGKSVFNFSKENSKNTIEDFLRNEENEIFISKNAKEFNEKFLAKFQSSKRFDLISEYSDMTIRTFKLSGILSFENGLVNLTKKWLTKTLFSKIIKTNFLVNHETWINDEYFHENYDIVEIYNFSKESKEIISDWKKEFEIEDINELIDYFKEKGRKEFEEKIHKRFSNDKILEILPMFPNNNDHMNIKKMTTDGAKIPTIFEYIIAIAWHKICKKEFDLQKSMNLSLDGDGYPLSHAPGGDGDIIATYSNYDIMLEVTLMNKNAQKRGELEPVIRHGINLSIKNKKNNRNAYIFFISDELDSNVINIFKATSNIQLESTNSRGEYTDGILIFPLTIKQIIYLLNNQIDYELFTEKIFENYKNNECIKIGWHDDIWEKAIS